MVVKQKSSPLTWIKNNKLLVFILVLVLATVTIFIYRAYEKQQNKLAFTEARQAIDSIYTEVVAKVGRPDDFRHTSSCSRNFQEWGGGELSCDTGVDLLYSIDNREQATDLYKKIQAIVLTKNNVFIPNSTLSTSIKDELVVDTYYYSAYDSFKSKKGLACVAKYVYNTPKDTYLPVPKDKKGLYVTLGCFGGAKVAYYPLDN